MSDNLGDFNKEIEKKEGESGTPGGEQAFHYEYGEEPKPAEPVSAPAGVQIPSGQPTGIPVGEVPPAGAVPPAGPAVPEGGQTPPQQTQWTFNDYGPLGSNKPPKQKKPKVQKEKKPKTPNAGYKVLAILMSVLFVLSAAGFGGYVIYDMNREPSYAALPAGDGSTSSRASVDIQDTPQDNTPDDDIPTAGGKLSNYDVYKTVEPAVVGVVGYAKGTTGTQMASQGSGIIFEEDGYIVTNSHVVRNESTNLVFDKVEVILSNGEKYTAKVLGSDKETDLAVLKIDATGLKKAVFGDSDQVRVGDKALVIGNPSGLAFAGSMTLGTVSAVNRQVEMSSLNGRTTEFIQTDAAINPGNSGGALANEYGQVVGITSAKLVAEDYEGMGFAIPINNAKPIIESLINDGYVTGRVELGIGYKAVSSAIAEQTSIPQGLRVMTIKENADCLKQGLELGDIITRIDGKEVYDAITVSSALDGKKPGESVTLTVYRVGDDDKAKTLSITCKLAEKTEE